MWCPPKWEERYSVFIIGYCALWGISLLGNNFHLGTDEKRIVHWRLFHAFDDLKNSPAKNSSFWPLVISNPFFLRHSDTSNLAWKGMLILWILRPVSSSWCQISTYLEAIAAEGRLSGCPWKWPLDPNSVSFTQLPINRLPKMPTVTPSPLAKGIVMDGKLRHKLHHPENKFALGNSAPISNPTVSPEVREQAVLWTILLLAQCSRRVLMVFTSTSSNRGLFLKFYVILISQLFAPHPRFLTLPVIISHSCGNLTTFFVF